MITINQLTQSLRCPIARAEKWVDCINAAMFQFDINTPLREAHFLAQIGHESGRLIYTHEIASGSEYEGRKDLGNTEVGDGRRFKGRGLIQVTGRTNYKSCGDALGIDFINSPELLEVPQNAALSAAWFWSIRKLNELADADNLIAITKKINGGLNGLDDRKLLLDSSKLALGI